MPERRVSKTSGNGYFQARLFEAQRGVDKNPTVRVMKDENPNLPLDDFVRVTFKLKADFYIGRDGKPTGTLLIIAFNATKIAKPSELTDESKGKQQPAMKVESNAQELKSGTVPPRTPEPVKEMFQENFESDWTKLYN